MAAGSNDSPAAQGGLQFTVVWTFGKEKGILVCITDSFRQLLEFLLITTLRQEARSHLLHFCDNSCNTFAYC